MLALRSFARRLLVQALVSSIVMAGLQGVVHLAPVLLPNGDEPAETNRASTAAQNETAPATRSAKPTGSFGFAEDRTHADIKAGRFAVWRERETHAAETPRERIASAPPMRSLGDVMLFDRCRPSCESQDPLLVSRRHESVAASPIPEAGMDQVAQLDGVTANAAEAAVPPEPSENRSTVAAAARSGVSWARRMAETAGNAISW